MVDICRALKCWQEKRRCSANERRETLAKKNIHSLMSVLQNSTGQEKDSRRTTGILLMQGTIKTKSWKLARLSLFPFITPKGLKMEKSLSFFLTSSFLSELNWYLLNHSRIPSSWLLLYSSVFLESWNTVRRLKLRTIWELRHIPKTTKRTLLYMLEIKWKWNKCRSI